jgi:O-antigen ligase
LNLPENPPFLERPELIKLLIALGAFCIAVFFPLVIEGTMSPDERGFALYDPSAAIMESVKMAGVICAFALGLRCSQTDDAARRLLDVMIYTAGVWAAVSICMQIADPAGIYGVQKFGAGRLTGAFSSPNSAGTLFGAVSTLAFSRATNKFFASKRPHIIERIDPLMSAVFLFATAALMLTVSRGAIAATFICLLCAAIFFLRGRLPPAALIGGGIGAAIIAILIFVRPITRVVGRLDQLNTDADIRMTIFTAHLNHARQHPWLGSGLGSFNAINNHIIQATDYMELSVIRSAHNVYLQWFEETGLIGLCGLLALNLMILLPMIATVRKRRPISGRIFAILSGYLVFLLHGFTDYAFQEPALALFMAVMLGCGYGMATNNTKGSPSRSAKAAI